MPGTKKTEIVTNFNSPVSTTCCFATSVIFLAVLHNSLVSDDNAQKQLVGLISALDYTYSRVLNMSFCTHLMGTPFFPGPSLHMGVLSYSMITRRWLTEWHQRMYCTCVVDSCLRVGWYVGMRSLIDTINKHYLSRSQHKI